MISLTQTPYAKASASRSAPASVPSPARSSSVRLLCGVRRQGSTRWCESYHSRREARAEATSGSVKEGGSQASSMSFSAAAEFFVALALAGPLLAGLGLGLGEDWAAEASSATAALAFLGARLGGGAEAAPSASSTTARFPARL